MHYIDLEEFKKELSKVINHHSIDNLLGIPDFILADYINNIIAALVVMNEARKAGMNEARKELGEVSNGKR